VFNYMVEVLITFRRLTAVGRRDFFNILEALIGLLKNAFFVCVGGVFGAPLIVKTKHLGGNYLWVKTKWG